MATSPGLSTTWGREDWSSTLIEALILRERAAARRCLAYHHRCSRRARAAAQSASDRGVDRGIE